MRSDCTRWATAAVAALAIFAVAGCGSTTTTTSANASPAASVKASGDSIALSDLKVALSPTLKAGSHTFTITNKGAVIHELLVFKSALDVSKYPTESDGSIAEDASGITKISDGDNLDPGQSQTRTVDLSQPGTYLFVCNIPGHFAAHMYEVVTVS